MARNVGIQLLRGVDANKPALLAGELYCATDSGRVYQGTTPVRLIPVAGEANLTVQGAAIAATTLFTPAVTGLYRISYALKVKRAATTSSTLGGLTITFSDGTDSVAQSILALGQNQLGAAASTVSTNTTVANLTGSLPIWAVAGTAVEYAIAYISSGGTTMQYEAHLRAELL